MFKGFFVPAVALFLVVGCAKKQVVRPPADQPVPPAPSVQVPSDDGAEPSVRATDWTVLPEISVITFAYDSYELGAQARAALAKNAEYFKSRPELDILVEGHCDERGTVEYNLALGQRRASAVREYYGQLGVPLGRIGTISYGKEKPADPAHTEAAWARNRRAETKVRNR